MSTHQYILQPYKGISSRHKCPACGKPRTFSRYINSETNEVLNPLVGKCERLNNCAYHYPPKQYFADNGISPPIQTHIPKNTTPPKPATYIQPQIVAQSKSNYQSNHFATFLTTTFGVTLAQQAIARYNIGTSKHWQGATVFWQVDAQGNARTGKIMQYNPTTGKRVKEPRNCITWAHTLLKQPDFNLKQCLFGEHLLAAEPNKTICLVESEKTAVIASLYLPQYVWLAVGNLADLSPAKCQAIINRKVILLPDLKAYDKWQEKAIKISPRWQVSNFIETHATDAEKAQGLDIADYILAHSIGETTQTQCLQTSSAISTPPENPIIVQNSAENQKNSFGGVPSPINWDNDISLLQSHFAALQIPNRPIKLSPCETIIAAYHLIQSHLEILKANNGNPTFLPYLNRLYKLKQILQ